MSPLISGQAPGDDILAPGNAPDALSHKSGALSHNTRRERHYVANATTRKMTGGASFP